MARVKLVLEENQVAVLQANPKIHNMIDRATRFRARNFERTDKFKEGNWDGFTRLYNFREHTFPIGLLDNVEMMLLLKEIDYDVIDNRIFRTFPKMHIETDIELRDYQQAAVEKAIEKKRCVIQLPTGAGKTLVGVFITKKLGVPTVFYVHKKELLYQTARTYRQHLLFKECKKCPSIKKKRTGKCEHKSCPVGVIGDSHLDIKPITIAMIQSATRLPKSLFHEFGLMIGDEIHHVAAETYFEISNNTKSEYVIGLSATIRREDGKELMIYAGAGPITYNISTSDLIRRGYLATPHIHAIRVNPVMFSARDNYRTVYDKAITFNPERNEKIALKAVELSEFGPVYIHVRIIDHGETARRRCRPAQYVCTDTGLGRAVQNLLDSGVWSPSPNIRTSYCVVLRRRRQM